MPEFSERLSVYTHLRTFESDFDRSQSQIRTICSAWSAAVLGAVGLITVNAFTPPTGADLARGEHLAYLRGLICLIGSAGVFAFWFIDQRVYQKLLHSIFAYGLFLELKYRDLPQLRSSLFIANLDITSGLSWFYRMQFWIFLLIAAVFVVQPFAVDLGPVPKGIKGLTEVHFGLVILGEVRSRQWPSLQRIIRGLYPPLREAMPEPERGPIQKLLWTWLAYGLSWIGLGRLLAPEDTARRDAWKARVKSFPLDPDRADDNAAVAHPPPAAEENTPAAPELDQADI